MYKLVIAIFAIMLSVMSSQAQAQGNQLEYLRKSHKPSPHLDAVLQKAMQEDVIIAVETYLEICTAVYKAAVDHPYNPVRQQDVDGLTGYGTDPHIHSERFGDINLDIHINFEATQNILTKDKSWDGKTPAMKINSSSTPSILCTATISTSPRLKIHISPPWAIQISDFITSKQIIPNLKQMNNDCHNGIMSAFRMSSRYENGYEAMFSMTFPHEATRGTLEFPTCEKPDWLGRFHYGQPVSGTYHIEDDQLIDPNGQTVGTMNADGRVVDENGRMIARFTASK